MEERVTVFMNEFRFTPEKLIEAQKRLEALHRPAEPYDYSHPEETLEQLIRRIDGMPEDMLQAAAFALSDRDIRLAAGYLPYNFYEVSEQKLARLLNYRMDAEACRILFREWQEEFTNPQCNEFLQKMASSNGYFQELLREHHISKEMFQRILKSRSIPLAYDQQLIGGVFSDGEEFEKRLRYYGVFKDSFLDVECKRALLTFCEKEDYFSCSEENLLDILRTYNSYMLKIWLFNFLSKLNLQELENYPALASYMRQITGHCNSRTFQSFFEKAPENLVVKYVDWINIFKINTYFEGDERSSFWKQFRFLNVIRYPVSNVVILELDEYTVVEFLGDKKGTIYLCRKDVFMENFYGKLDRMDNEDLRIYFKAHKDLCEESRNHLGRWQSHMGNLFRKQGIAEKLKERKD